MSRRSRLFVSTQVKDWGQSPLSRVPDSTLIPEKFSPDLWLDASDATTITAVGGAVSQWDNKGSLGNFTQATGAVQPTTGSTTLNGLNVIDFAADYLVAANTNEWKFLHDGTKYILAWVWKAGTGSNPGTIYTLAGSNNGQGNNTGVLYYYEDGGVNNGFGAYISPNNVVNILTADKLTPNTFQAVTLLADPSNATAANRLEYFVNGGSGNKGNTGSSAVSSSNPSAALEIGRGSTVGVLTGSIAEIVVVSGTNATETNRAALRDYLNTKWGVY